MDLEKLKKVLMTTIMTLSIPIIILNIFGGIVSGIWLAILGEWDDIGMGIGFIFVSGFGISFALMPGLLFSALAMLAFERGKKVIGIILGYIASLYTYALITVWCIFIMGLFVKSATKSSIIPLLIWSYGIALAPWVWLTRKDQQGGGNDASIFATFITQITYVVAMIMFFLGVSIGKIAITFGTIMLIASFLQVTIVFGGEIGKSFYKKEVKEAFAILEEEKDKWDCAGFNLVKDYVEESIRSDKKQFMDEVREGRSVRTIVYNIIANLSEEMIESGQYHIWGGVLNPMGPGEDLLKIFDSAVDELVIMGELDEEKAQEQKEAIRLSVQSFG